MWNLTYGLTTVKEGEHTPIEVKDDEEDDHNDIVEGGTKMQLDDKEIVEPE